MQVMLYSLLVADQLDVNVQDSNGCTFLHLMLEHGDYKDVLKIASDYMSSYRFNLELRNAAGNDIKVSLITKNRKPYFELHSRT